MGVFSWLKKLFQGLFGGIGNILKQAESAQPVGRERKTESDVWRDYVDRISIEVGSDVGAVSGRVVSALEGLSDNLGSFHEYVQGLRSKADSALSRVQSVVREALGVRQGLQQVRAELNPDKFAVSGPLAPVAESALGKLSSSLKELDDAGASLRDADRFISGADKARSDLESALKGLEELVLQFRASRNSLRKKVNDARSKEQLVHKDLQREVAAFQESAEKFRRRADEARARYDDARKRLKRARRRGEGVESADATVREAYNELVRITSSFQESAQAYRSKVGSVRSRIGSVHAELLSLEQKIRNVDESLRSEAAAARSRIGPALERLEGIEKAARDTVQSMIEGVSASKSRAASAVARLSEIKGLVRNFNAAHARAAEELEPLNDIERSILSSVKALDSGMAPAELARLVNSLMSLEDRAVAVHARHLVAVDGEREMLKKLKKHGGADLVEGMLGTLDSWRRKMLEGISLHEKRKDFLSKLLAVAAEAPGSREIAVSFQKRCRSLVGAVKGLQRETVSLWQSRAA